jgi:8-oxo-dGTP pyrophosphatase MutT (NUDIX family)
MTEKNKSESRPLKKSLSLLKQLAAGPDKLLVEDFRQQYGALCFRYKNDGPAIEILVVTSRDSGRWIIPKGWPVQRRQPHESAAKEAWQEAGVRGKVKKKPIGSYTYMKSLSNDEVVPCIVDIFQIEVKETNDQFKESAERVVAWVSPEEAARRVQEVELKSLVVEFTPQRHSRKAADR